MADLLFREGGAVKRLREYTQGRWADRLGARVTAISSARNVAVISPPQLLRAGSITEPRAAREANMATLVPSRSARRIAGGNSGALIEADFRGCRWIEGEPKPLRRGMFCGRRVLTGESWCAMHHLVVFGEERRR